MLVGYRTASRACRAIPKFAPRLGGQSAAYVSTKCASPGQEASKREKEIKRRKGRRSRAREIYTAYVAVASSSARAVGLGGKSWVKLEGEAEKEARRIYAEERVARAARAKRRIGMKGGKRGRGRNRG